MWEFIVNKIWDLQNRWELFWEDLLGVDDEGQAVSRCCKAPIHYGGYDDEKAYCTKCSKRC